MGKAIRLLPVLVPLAKLLAWLPQRGSYKPYFSTGYYMTLYDDPAWMEVSTYLPTVFSKFHVSFPSGLREIWDTNEGFSGLFTVLVKVSSGGA